MTEPKAPEVVKIGEAEYQPDQLQKIVAEHGQLSQQMEGFKSLREFAESLNMTPEELTSETRGAFARLTQLVQAGVLGEDLELVQKAPAAPPATPPPGTPPPKHTEGTVTLEQVKELMQEMLKPIVADVGVVKTSTKQLTGHALQGSLRARHPSITDEQIAKAVVRAGKDRNKTVIQHADDIIGEVGEYRKQIKEELIKEYGLDPNQLQEQGGDAEAATLIKGRKVTFNPKGENETTPLELTKQLFKARIR